VPAENDPPTGLAERVWWARLHRAGERQGLLGSPGVMADWSHAMLAVLAAGPERTELVPGTGWQPVPPERCTDEYKQAETRRLCDELGRKLGVGPMPMSASETRPHATYDA
jgi:hypothetical protein